MRQRFLVLLAVYAASWPCGWTVGAADALERTQRGGQFACLPSLAPAPADNPTTAAKVALGKQLFFDPRLSGDNSMSCATCHIPEKGWSDGLPRAKGAGGRTLDRNTQTLVNAAFYGSFFWDGRAATLEQQAPVPIASPKEMDQDLDQLVQELSQVPGYARQFREVFQSPVTAGAIAQALSAFQRTLISRNSPFDRYLADDRSALSEKAKRGMELFAGEADCIRCHNGPHLSDGKFYRLGVDFKDQGRRAVTGKSQDRYRFRTPSLRDVATTAPYMHDGSEKSLFDVVEFYLRDAPVSGPGGMDLDIQPQAAVSYSDIDAIVEFLKSLSGETPKVTPPTLP